MAVYLRIFFTQDADIGIFLSISSLVAKGYTLYSEAFEIKDPYFFYSNGLFLKLFGLRGPFFLDSLYLLLVPFLTYFISIKYKLTHLQSYLATIFFVFTYSGLYFQPVRTQTPAIIAFLAATLSLKYCKYFLAGIFCSIVLLSKLPLIVLCISFLPVLLSLDVGTKIRSFMKFIFGFSLFSTLFYVIMHLRGEFFPYLRMIQENFTYAGSFTSLVGMPTGVLGHIKLWDDSKNRVIVYLMLVIVLFFITIKMRNSKNIEVYFVSLLAMISIGVFLAMTMLWWHHLEILCLIVLFGFVSIFNFGNEMIKNSSKDISLFITVLGLALTIFNAGAAGVTFQSQPSMQFSSWLKPSWTVPIEISALNSVTMDKQSDKSFARLGINDELGFIAFLPDDWQFECDRLGILGWESESTLKEHLDCLSARPKVILISEMHYKINLSAGYFPEFKSHVDRLLLDRFECRYLWDTKFKVCVRRDASFQWTAS